MRAALVGLLALAAFVALPANAQVREEPQISESSDEFGQGAAGALQALATAGFDRDLSAPSLGALSTGAFDRLVQDISRETPIPTVATGSRGVTYDIILQPGHYGRTTGRVGTQGARVSERALVAFITERAAQSLRQRGLNVLVISADNYLRDDQQTPDYDGLRAKAFLAIHADGSVRACSTGPSLAYKTNSSLLAMHAIGYGLSVALGYDYADFRRDNFTANSAQYYMFDRVEATNLTGLLEIGELTCPRTEDNLISSAEEIADNVAHALAFVVSTEGSN